MSASRISLSWTDHANNETGFRIQRSTNGGAFVNLTTVGPNITTFSDTGVAVSSTYSYRVAAFNSAGSSAQSNTAPVALLLPAAPTNLTANVTKHSDVNLTWKDNSNNETGFQIERSSNGTAFDVMATVPANTTTYKDRKGARQTRYYRVAARNNLGLSKYSNIVKVP